MSLEQREPIARPEVVSHILKAAEWGVNVYDPTHGALHGSSIETLQFVMQHGIVPGVSARMEDHLGKRGDIFINLTPALQHHAERIDPDLAHMRLERPQEALLDCIVYAKMAAREHYFLNVLELPFDDRDTRDKVSELFGDMFIDNLAWNEGEHGRSRIEYFQSLGISEARVSETVEQAIIRQGFLFGFSPDVQHNKGLELIKGDWADERIRTFGKGLSFKYISALVPWVLLKKDFFKACASEVSLEFAEVCVVFCAVLDVFQITLCCG